MKVKEARDRLSNYSGEELHREAHTLYGQETDDRINLRSHGQTPSRVVVESVVNEMRPWMEKVGDGLPWSYDRSLSQIIEFETGATWVRYKITDPRIEAYVKRTRFNVLSGTPIPAYTAITPESLDALSSMSLARITEEARTLKEQMEKEEK